MSKTYEIRKPYEFKGHDELLRTSLMTSVLIFLLFGASEVSDLEKMLNYGAASPGEIQGGRSYRENGASVWFRERAGGR